LKQRVWPPNRKVLIPVLLGTLLTVSVAPSALGDGTLPITITNDNPDTILVTAYDMNAQPRAAVLKAERINGFGSIPLSVTPGIAGYGHISWTATGQDAFFRKCGHGDRPRLSNGAVVHVHARSTCPSSQE
jgi:hypothetical protein